MKVSDYLKSEESAVKFCPARRHCPVGQICAMEDAEGTAPLFPRPHDFKQEDLIFSDLRFEQRVHFIQTGILATIGTVEGNREVPFALNCTGHSIGIAALYVPREVTGTYYVQALTDGRACSFPAKALRRRIEAMPNPWSQRLLAHTITNIANSAYAQSVIISTPRVADRIATLLLYMHDMLEWEGRGQDQLHLTQALLAKLVCADRITATRALHKLEEQGLVQLGYKSIGLTEKLLKEYRPEGANLVFYNVNDLE